MDRNSALKRFFCRHREVTLRDEPAVRETESGIVHAGFFTFAVCVKCGREKRVAP